MKEQARKQLAEIIDKIAELAQMRHQLQINRRKIQDKISLLDSQTVIDISLARNESGKPIYSNEQIREAERTRRLLQNEEFQAARTKAREIDDEIHSIGIENNRLTDHKMLLMLELGLLPPAGEI